MLTVPKHHDWEVLHFLPIQVLSEIILIPDKILRELIFIWFWIETQIQFLVGPILILQFTVWVGSTV